MIWNDIIPYHIILLLFSSLSMAGDYTPIIDQIKPNTITIIGEQHKHPESIILFQTLISDYLKQHKCLTIGLEIYSNQQPIIDHIKYPP